MSMDEVFASSDGAGSVQQVEDRVRGLLRLVADPIRFDGVAPPIRMPPPLLGEHDAEVRRRTRGGKRTVTAADRWRDRLAEWAIPEEILANAPESPWGFETECFRRRGEAAPVPEPTPTTRRALEALPQGGTVIDVGVGGGATSLPLAVRAGFIVGVDQQPDMLEGFLANAAAAGVEARAVTGAWPEAAAEIEPADVVVAGHVFYNIPALEPFARAMDAHARFRVVVELTERHPLDWMLLGATRPPRRSRRSRPSSPPAGAGCSGGRGRRPRAGVSAAARAARPSRPPGPRGAALAGTTRRVGLLVDPHGVDPGSDAKARTSRRPPNTVGPS